MLVATCAKLESCMLAQRFSPTPPISSWAGLLCGLVLRLGKLSEVVTVETSPFHSRPKLLRSRDLRGRAGPFGFPLGSPTPSRQKRARWGPRFARGFGKTGQAREGARRSTTSLITRSRPERQFPSRPRELHSYLFRQALADFRWQPVMHVSRPNLRHINHDHGRRSRHGHDQPDQRRQR